MIPRELFDRYDSALSANARLLQRAVDTAAALVSDGTAWRDVYLALVRQYGRFAALAALEFYQGCREASGVAARYEALLVEPDDEADLIGDVARAAGSVTAAGQMAQRLQASAKRRVMERADTVLVRNAQRDPAHPKWALVPHPGACAWCRFLASQDFAYSSSASALAARHDNCLCTPVVDFDVENPHLDGYDPDVYYGEYADARSEVEAEAREEWLAMTPEERKAYAQKGRGAYDRFLRNKIVQAMSKGEEER